VPVPGLTGITQLAAGDNHSLALRSDGTAAADPEEHQRRAGGNGVLDAGPRAQLCV
jgi:hypothetical protein